MPFKPPHPCNQPGCAALTNERFCPPHAVERERKYERERGSAAKRGYGSKWRKASKGFLALPENAPCRICKGRGIVTLAVLVDHIIPHRGDKQLFWRRSNWQPLCKKCHDTKTATEDGRSG